MAAKRLCLVTRIAGVAGPAGFQRRLAEGLAHRGVQVTYSLADRPYQAVLVIGGTRHLGALSEARRNSVPIVQRLDGINWIHRRRRTGMRHFLRAEANNLILRWVRDHLATRVVYQSDFARRWWDSSFGPAPVPSQVVHNGVPLEVYRPDGPEVPPSDRIRLLVVEANLTGGYDLGLDWAVDLSGRVSARLGRPVELAVAGRAAEAVRARQRPAARASIQWLGLVPAEKIPGLDRGAHLLFASDVMPACPNSVIEALACGLPVVSFDTGALPELVTGEAGRLVPFGADPWRLQPPDIEALANAATEVLDHPGTFRAGARRRAEAGLSLEAMVQGYLGALGWES